MFTGIVTLVRPLLRKASRGSDTLLWVDLEPWLADLALGESVAVDGACLTVEALEGSQARFSLSEETLAKTRFGRRAAGDRLNLERALRLSDRLGGHLVSGHVDGLGALRSRRASGGGEVLELEVPSELERYLIDKGSIAVDGVSLTVNRPRGRVFSVWVVPHTLVETNLGDLAPGDPVHLEADQVAKWIERLLPGGAGARSMRELLERSGFEPGEAP